MKLPLLRRLDRDFHDTRCLIVLEVPRGCGQGDHETLGIKDPLMVRLRSRIQWILLDRGCVVAIGLPRYYICEM